MAFSSLDSTVKLISFSGPTVLETEWLNQENQQGCTCHPFAYPSGYTTRQSSKKKKKEWSKCPRTVCPYIQDCYVLKTGALYWPPQFLKTSGNTRYLLTRVPERAFHKALRQTILSYFATDCYSRANWFMVWDTECLALNTSKSSRCQQK